MKKSILILIVLLLILCGLFLLIFSNSKYELQVLKIFTDENITYDLVDKALNGNKNSLREIAGIILDNINLNEWKNDPSIKIQICKGNILSGPEEEIIVGLSLPPDTGIVSILEPEINKAEYDIYYTTTDLVPIDSLKIINTPNWTNSLMYVKETLDESFGAFFKSTIIEIYGWKDNRLEELWNGTESYTACWNTAWEENGSDNKWMKLKENAIISMNKDNTEITVFSNQRYMESTYVSENIPEDDEFKTIKERKLVSTYYLDNELKRYIRGTASLNNNTILYDYDGMDFVKKLELPDGETVKLLQDLNELADNLINNKLNYYKIITSNGLTGYISKEAISIK
ncbi:MAG: hypothetical protein QME46_08555 [Thermoanaerobacteraceae bacterium]|nr:hypothetical protein [Thermoanaerobacteraceae bacterium]